jgi:uncharacterized protein (TIGR03435 family)
MEKIACVCLVITAALGLAQNRPAFEVASIKLHPYVPGPLSVTGGVTSAGVRLTNATLKNCITKAYGVPPYLISGGPGWLASERYDIDAKAATAAPRAQLMLMLQTLLEDRFQLKVHLETKEQPIYALVVAKNGPKIHPVKDEDDMEINGNSHQFTARQVSMQEFAGALARQFGSPVQDMTGLKGVYDFALDLAPEGSVADDGPSPSIFAALQEQLGLRLEARKGPMEVLVVDRAERASQN